MQHRQHSRLWSGYRRSFMKYIYSCTSFDRININTLRGFKFEFWRTRRYSPFHHLLIQLFLRNVVFVSINYCNSQIVTFVKSYINSDAINWKDFNNFKILDMRRPEVVYSSPCSFPNDRLLPFSFADLHAPCRRLHSDVSSQFRIHVLHDRGQRDLPVRVCLSFINFWIVYYLATNLVYAKWCTATFTDKKNGKRYTKRRDWSKIVVITLSMFDFSDFRT